MLLRPCLQENTTAFNMKLFLPSHNADRQKQNHGIRSTGTLNSNYISLMKRVSASPIPDSCSNISYDDTPSPRAVNDIKNGFLRVESNPTQIPSYTVVQVGVEEQNDSALQHWLTTAVSVPQAAALQPNQTTSSGRPGDPPQILVPGLKSPKRPTLAPAPPTSSHPRLILIMHPRLELHLPGKHRPAARASPRFTPTHIQPIPGSVHPAPPLPGPS
jgi:hypothetical protein